MRIVTNSENCFVNADMIIRRNAYPSDLNERDVAAQLPELVCRGGSCIIDPYGHTISETIWDEEGIIYAELDMSKVPASRMEHDVCGHYARPDVLKLHVRDE